MAARDRNALKLASANSETWNELEALSQASANANNSGRDTTSNADHGVPDEADDLTTLFRNRCLLYETSIYADLFPQDANDDLSLISTYTIQNKAAELQSQATAAASADTRRKVRTEDDDYDDEESDAEEPTTVSNGSALASDQTQSNSPAVNKSAITHGTNAGSKFSDADAIEDRKNEDKILAFEINTMYHTLEYDRHALLEQNTLEASDRQVEEESDHIETEKLSSVNFGAANLSLKHLISKIDKSREKLAMSDNELRTLLSEVRKNRSKWANEDKVGQEELYEAAERVVLELRGYTEHSTAFLNKVTKRDVPDYYNIIKEPMDLGTLMKNLKNIVYKSKSEFAKDVMLIWDNCLTYNADAAHPLRKHAYAMRRKSEQLLSMVPEVTIRDRADVEAEEFGLLDVDQDEEEDKPLAGKSTRGTFGPKSSKSKKSKSAKKAEDNEKTSDDTNGVKAEDVDEEMSHSPERTLQAQKSVPDDVDEATQVLQRAGSDAEETDETDVPFQVWRTRTKKTRARYASARHKRMKQDALRSEELALKPSAASLARMLLADSAEGTSTMNSVHGLGPISSRPNSSGSASSDNMVLPEYEPCSIPRTLTAMDAEPPADFAFPVQNSSTFEPRSGGLVEKMQATTLHMKNIRKLCTKLSTLKLMQDPTMSAFPASYFRQLMESEPPLRFEQIELYQSGYDAQPCGEELARSLLQRSSSHILYQAGFEDFQPEALESFTEIAAEFVKLIGKIMKEYTESRQPLTEEEILRHTLFEVGIPDLNVLEDYVVEEIDTKGEKIVGLHDRLKKFLNDFIQGTVDGDSGDQDLFDEKNRDAFVAGSFGDETGEDFFGFRELGLEKEFGMSSLSVPLRLLQGRLRPVTGGSTIVGGESVSALRFDRRFPHITKEVAERQIGIFRTFLESKIALLDTEDEPYLIEDEDLPNRQRKPKPRLGPTGKISKSFHLPPLQRF